jgi:hypothetical protein
MGQAKERAPKVITADISKSTKARALQKITKPPMSLRLWTVACGFRRGSRGTRAFASEGSRLRKATGDIVGNHSLKSQ